MAKNVRKDRSKQMKQRATRKLLWLLFELKIITVNEIRAMIEKEAYKW